MNAHTHDIVHSHTIHDNVRMYMSTDAHTAGTCTHTCMILLYTQTHVYTASCVKFKYMYLFFTHVYVRVHTHSLTHTHTHTYIHTRAHRSYWSVFRQQILYQSKKLFLECLCGQFAWRVSQHSDQADWLHYREWRPSTTGRKCRMQGYILWSTSTACPIQVYRLGVI
jgi:hypothetical protein